MGLPAKPYFGIDLDIEGTPTGLPSFGDFLAAFRAGQPFASAPLQDASHLSAHPSATPTTPTPDPTHTPSLNGHRLGL
eukprot:gene11589-10052_t